jgi:hypothetical protein
MHEQHRGEDLEREVALGERDVGGRERLEHGGTARRITAQATDRCRPPDPRPALGEEQPLHRPHVLGRMFDAGRAEPAERAMVRPLEAPERLSIRRW